MTVALSDLQLLLDVVELGSFSQAAAKRGWSQPQVSQRIGVLEQEWGVSLFTRHRRGAVATNACQAFLESASLAVSAYREGLEAMQGTPSVPRIRLSCLPSLTSPVFGPLLMKLADAPMEIRCGTDHSQQIMQDLLTGQVEVGFVLKCPAMAGIQMEMLWRSPIVPVVASHHPLALHRGPLALSDIARYRIAPQFWGKECEALIQQIRIVRQQASPIHAVQPASAARELVLRHGFVSFMPELSVKADLQDGTLQRLCLPELPAWHWEVMMAWRVGKRVDAAKAMVLDAARMLAKEH